MSKEGTARNRNAEAMASVDALRAAMAETSRAERREAWRQRRETMLLGYEKVKLL